MKRVHLKMVFVAAAFAANLEASYIVARSECNGGGTLQGQNDQVQTGTPGQVVTATMPNSACVSTAVADFSTLKIGTNAQLLAPPSSGVPGTWIIGNARAEVQISFQVFDPSLPANSPGVLYLPIIYDLTLSSGTGGFAGVTSGVDFILVDPSNPFTRLVNLSSGSDPNNGGGTCPNPVPALPACNGRYQGTATYAVNVNYNPTGYSGRVWLSAQASALNGSVDAMHTISFGNIIIPNGVTYAYDSAIPAGNPLGFTTATPAQGVPEPGTLVSFGIGLLAIALGRRRRA